MVAMSIEYKRNLIAFSLGRLNKNEESLVEEAVDRAYGAAKRGRNTRKMSQFIFEFSGVG